jgi:hypothetical protein
MSDADAMQVDTPARISTASPMVDAPGTRASSVPLIPASFRVGYVYSERMMLHNRHPVLRKDDEDEHPERPERIMAVHRLFDRNALIRNMKRIPIRPVREDEVTLVHSRQLWNKVESYARKFTLGKSRMALILMRFDRLLR